MLFIDSTFKQQSPTLYLEILSSIDTKIYEISKIILYNIKFAQSSFVNYNTLEDLVIYRDILDGIIHCSTCLCDINVNSVIQRINKLLNTPC